MINHLLREGGPKRLQTARKPWCMHFSLFIQWQAKVLHIFFFQIFFVAPPREVWSILKLVDFAKWSTSCCGQLWVRDMFCGRDLWWTMPLHIFHWVSIDLWIPDSEIDHLHLSSESAVKLSMSAIFYPLVTATCSQPEEMYLFGKNQAENSISRNWLDPKLAPLPFCIQK